jgi:hypothetical protein
MKYVQSVTEIRLRVQLKALLPAMIELLGEHSATVQDMREAIAASEAAAESIKAEMYKQVSND